MKIVDCRMQISEWAGRKPAIAIAAAAAMAGCHTDMWVQPKTSPLDAADTALFVDGASARPLVPGTVAKGHLRNDQPFFTGIENGRYMDRLPMPVTRELLARGQERYNIYCSPCHSQIGDGKGMIAQRGLQLRRPVGNYHTDRLRRMPVGYFYDVITNGYGAMYSYASRVEPRDRWAISAYIRALQLSQNAPAAMADPTELQNSLNPEPTTPNPAEVPGH